MRKILTLFLIVLFGVLCLITHTMPADAAKKAKKTRVDEAQLQQMTEKINTLTAKYYTRELYSPADSDNLINLKLQLDGLMDIAPEPVYAPIYFKLAKLFKLREMKSEAIDSFKTIIENFSDTAYSPKAIEELREMGVVIEQKSNADDEDDF